MNYRKILLIQLRQLGDILLTTPCIREIRKKYPDSQICFLSHKMGRLILEKNPYLDEILTYHERDTLSQKWALLKKLRQENFDLVIDFMGNPRSAFYCLASGAKQRAGFRSSRKFAYTTLRNRIDEGMYIVREKFLLLDACEIESNDVSLTFPWFSPDLKPWLNFEKALPAENNHKIRVILSPTHRREIRKWPIHCYALLADYLTEYWDAQVVWIWGPGEQEEIHQAMSLCKQKTWIAPATNLSELAALCARQDLFVGNSNGPSHIAVSANICTLQLHGHTEAVAWCPETKQHKSIQSPEYGQAEHVTLKSITVPMVIEKLEAMKPLILERLQKRQGLGKEPESWQDTI